MDFETDPDTDTKSEHNALLEHESFSSSLSRVVIAHILASKYPKPNAFGANITFHSKLNLPVWKHYLADYSDRDSIIFLQFGWPMNYTSPVSPQSTCANHPSALAYPDHVQHYPLRGLSIIMILITSSLQIVHQPDSSERRVATDLSFPHTASVKS